MIIVDPNDALHSFKPLGESLDLSNEEKVRQLQVYLLRHDLQHRDHASKLLATYLNDDRGLFKCVRLLLLLLLLLLAVGAAIVGARTHST